MVKLLCQVCGEPTTVSDRVWFPSFFQLAKHTASSDPPVHRACADLARLQCPHLREIHQQPVPFPSSYSLGMERLKVNGRIVIGALLFVCLGKEINDRDPMPAGHC